jgi:hypothetical protein
LYSLTILINLISLTTLAILPALVPILAPLLALASEAASAYSLLELLSFVSFSFYIPTSFVGVSPIILLQIGSISVISDNVDTRSSQKKKEFR